MSIPKIAEGKYADIYKDEPKKPISSKKTERDAIISAWYLTDTMSICRDHGVTIEKNNGRKEYYGEWLLMLPERCFKYSKDIELSQTALTDFWNGWAARTKYGRS